MAGKSTRRISHDLSLVQASEILESISDGFYALDSNWRFIYVNHQACALIGLKPADLIGQVFWEKHPRLKGTDLETNFRKAMEEGQPQEFNMPAVYRKAWFHYHVYPSPRGISVYIQDFTERIKADEALRSSEEIFRAMADISPVGIGIVGIPDGEYLFVNPAYEQIFGYTLSELRRHKAADIFFNIRDRRRILHQLEQNNLKADYEVKLKRKDGSGFWGMCSARPITFKGKPALLGVFLDITQRKELEEDLLTAKDELEIKVKERTRELQESYDQLRKSQEALLAGQSRLKATIDAIPAGVWFVDSSGRVIEENQQARSIWGENSLTLNHIKDINAYKGFWPDTGEEIRREDWAMYQALNNGETIINQEINILRFDGTKGTVLNSAAPIFDILGHLIGGVAVQQDITELRKIRVALEKSRNELAEANRQLKEYGRRITQVQEEERKRIAYELHDDTAQYLSILKLEIEALLHSGEIKSPKLLNKLEYLQKDAERAFNDVRRYSHELRPGVLEHLGLQAALEQIVEDINKLKQIPVELHVEGSEPKVTEEVKLAFFRIAQEAINNARKHAQANKISVALSFKPGRVWMMISDDGTGFNTRQAAKKSGSRGSLGLMSMRERANLINANLKIESEPGKGTLVILKARL